MAQNKLLLVEDVEALGRSGDVVTVKPGYARNYLLPEGFAIVADKHTLRMQARLQEERQKKAIVDRKDSEEIAARFEGAVLSTIVKVDHEGHMYGSVNSADVADLLQQETQITLDKRSIQLKHPIKTTGVHIINLKLKEGVTASFKLKVIPDTQKGREEMEASEIEAVVEVNEETSEE